MKQSHLTRRRFLSTTAGLVAASSIAGSRPSFGQAPAITGQANKATVRLDWYVTGEHAPFFVGLEKGTFAKAGIDLTVNAGRGSSLTAQAVAAGQETFGLCDAGTVALIVPRGAQIHAVYGYVQQTFGAVMFFNDSGIKTPKDLEGKRYGDIPGAASNAILPIFLKRQGADSSKVKMIGIDFDLKAKAFLDRQFEATSCSAADDLITLRMQGNDLGAFIYSEMGLNMLGASLIASNARMEKSPNLVRSFIAGFQEAVALTLQDIPGAAEIVKKHVPDSPDAKIQAAMIPEVVKRLRTKNSEGKAPGYMAEPDWQSTVDTLTQAGIIQMKLDVASLYTNDFLLS